LRPWPCQTRPLSGGQGQAQLLLDGAPLAAGDAGGVRGVPDGLRHVGCDALIEHAWEDVVLVQLLGGDDRRDGLRRRELHRLVDGPRLAVEGAAHDPGKRQHVVDLVRVIGSTRGDDSGVVLNGFRHDLRRRIGHREHDGVRVHLLYGFRFDEAGTGEADQDVGAREEAVRVAPELRRVRLRRDLLLERVHASRAAPVDGSLAVAEDDVARAGRQQDAGARHAGRARAQHDDAYVFNWLLYDLQRVLEGGEDHDGRPMLVIVEDWDVHALAEGVLDDETAGRGDVLEVHAAEGRRDARDRLDDLLGVLGVEADGEGVEPAELFEEHALAFHDRHGAVGADVAEAKHRGAIADDGHGVALDGQVPRFGWIPGNGHRNACHTGRVRHRQIVPGFQRRFARDLDLAAQMEQERPVRDVDDLDPLDAVHARGDGIGVGLIARVDGDVADQRGWAGASDVDGANVAALFPNRGCEPSQHPRPVFQCAADGDAVARARLNVGGHWQSPQSAQGRECALAVRVRDSAIVAQPTVRTPEAAHNGRNLRRRVRRKWGRKLDSLVDGHPLLEGRRIPVGLDQGPIVLELDDAIQLPGLGDEQGRVVDAVSLGWAPDGKPVRAIGPADALRATAGPDQHLGARPDRTVPIGPCRSTNGGYGAPGIGVWIITSTVAEIPDGTDSARTAPQKHLPAGPYQCEPVGVAALKALWHAGLHRNGRPGL